MKWPTIPKIINFPQTTTLLALGFLAGILLFAPTMAMLGDRVPEWARADVSEVAKLFRDGMLLILGYYFAKVVNAGQESLASKAMDKVPPAEAQP